MHPDVGGPDERLLRLVHQLRAISVQLDLARAAFARANALHDTDVRALICLLDAERADVPAMAGWLGSQLGLTSPATTALIDRLETAGYVRRLPSPADRRKVEIRVSRLVLLDPTDTFMPLSLRYRLHAIPLLARPAARRMRRFLAWETRGRPLDEAWLAVVCAGQDLGRAKIVMPRCPRPGQLAGLHVPALVIVAGRSRAHDACEIARRARARLPGVTTASVADATHHTIPAADVPELLGHIEPFLAGES